MSRLKIKVILTLDFVLELSGSSSVHEDKISNSEQDLFSIRSEAHCPNLVGLTSLWRWHWDLLLPLDEGSHFRINYLNY